MAPVVDAMEASVVASVETSVVASVVASVVTSVVASVKTSVVVDTVVAKGVLVVSIVVVIPSVDISVGAKV